MATFLVYGQFYPYVNPVPRSGSNNRSQAIAILASVLCKKMRLAIPSRELYRAKPYLKETSAPSRCLLREKSASKGEGKG